MSSNSNSFTADQALTSLPMKERINLQTRRQVLRSIAGLSFVMASGAFAYPLPRAGLKRWGNGEFRRFGLLIYEATLWAGDDPLNPPLALRLDYKRNIRGSVIAEASIQEMRKFDVAEAALSRWGEQMRGLFPDVRAGDHIIGLHFPERASFLLNGEDLGEIADPEFARRFFGIWLDPRTSAPELRAALLKRPG